MQKWAIFTTTLLFVSLLLNGCAVDSASPTDAQTASYTQFDKTLTLKEVSTLIMEAGEKAGWRMTKLSENSVVAEKINGDNATATTVYFTQNSFKVSPHNGGLEDILEDTLSK